MPLPSQRRREGLPVFTCLVLDRQLLVGQAVGGLLAEHCDLDLVGVFSALDEVIAFVQYASPDLLLVDIKCEGKHGETWQDVATVLAQKNPESRLIVITEESKQFIPPPEIEPILLGIVDKNHGIRSGVGTAHRELQPC